MANSPGSQQSLSVGNLKAFFTFQPQLNVWYQVILRAQHSPADAAGSFVSLNIGAQNYVTSAKYSATITTEDTDIFQIGGFVGDLQDLQIFSPVSGEVVSRNFILSLLFV